MRFDSNSLTVYFGGTGLGFWSLAPNAEAAKAPPPDVIPLLAYPVPVVEITIGDILGIASFAVVLAKFYLDVKDRRKKR
ncbi:MAG: hypothetical protein ACRC8D_08405 [Aeromonas sp.]